MNVILKEVGKVTSFNRTAIYNYFNTKEEIFLALMQREYDLWVVVMNFCWLCQQADEIVVAEIIKLVLDLKCTLRSRI